MTDAAAPSLIDLLRSLLELPDLSPARIARALGATWDEPATTGGSWVHYREELPAAKLELAWDTQRSLGRLELAPRDAAPTGKAEIERALRPLVGDPQVAGDPMPNPPMTPDPGFDAQIEAWKRRSYFLYALPSGQLRIELDVDRVVSAKINGFIRSTTPRI